MGLLGDITQFSGISLLKKATKKKKKQPSALEQELAHARKAETIAQAEVIDTGDERAFSEGFKDKTRRDMHGRARMKAY